MKKRLLGILLCIVMVFALAACGTKDEETGGKSNDKDSDGKKTIGVCMPTKTLQRWNQDGDYVKKQLEAAGYKVDLQYADDDIQTQVTQVENMIANNVSVLVIASIDGDSLGTVLAQAKEKNIPVIAHDRLIMNTDAVTYYATFDNYKVGQKQGEYIEKTLDLKNAAGPFNIELITGDPGDNNAKFFFSGAMDILQPYIDSGKLVVVSGQTEFAEVATAEWKTEKAQNRMESILSSFYADGTVLHAVMANNDSTALGVANALTSSYSGPWPILTGQDCDIANVKNMIAGKQSMSVFKDTRELAKQVVLMVQAIMEGKDAPINDTETYNNGVFNVPTYQCEPVYADVNNYRELLIDSGYYTEDDLK